MHSTKTCFLNVVTRFWPSSILRLLGNLQYIAQWSWGECQWDVKNCLPDWNPLDILVLVIHVEHVPCLCHRILTYEMLAGQPPFDYKLRKKNLTSRDRKSLMNRITTGRISKPRICSRVAWDLIQGLLARDPSARLGSGGSDDVKNHPFFKSIDWEALEQRRVPSEFKPVLPNSLSVGMFWIPLNNTPFYLLGVGISAKLLVYSSLGSAK